MFCGRRRRANDVAQTLRGGLVHIRTPKLCAFGRPTCAHSDARLVHIRTPEVCTFGRPSCAHPDVRTYVSKDVCLVGGHIVMDPNIGFAESGVCEKKYRPKSMPASAVAPFPHKVNVVEPSKGHVRVQKRYFFSLRLGHGKSSSTLITRGEEAGNSSPGRNRNGTLFRKHRTRQNQCWGP